MKTPDSFRRSIRRNRFSALCAAFILLAGSIGQTAAAPAPATLSARTLKQDLNYYKSLCGRQKLTVNDRYYVLLRIEKRYKASRVDLKPLRDEMKLLHRKSQKEPVDATPQKTGTQPPTPAPEPFPAEPKHAAVIPASAPSASAAVPDEVAVLAAAVPQEPERKTAASFRSDRISVIGGVQIPGYYDYQPNLYLCDLITRAGGFTNNARIEKASILRSTAAGDTSLKINIAAILDGAVEDIRLEKGDIVYIPNSQESSTSSYFTSRVLPWASLGTILVLLAHILI